MPLIRRFGLECIAVYLHTLQIRKESSGPILDTFAIPHRLLIGPIEIPSLDDS